jgi:hypothetical protein
MDRTTAKTEAMMINWPEISKKKNCPSIYPNTQQATLV